jgi:hypothetical protein
VKQSCAGSTNLKLLAIAVVAQAVLFAAMNPFVRSAFAHAAAEVAAQAPEIQPVSCDGQPLGKDKSLMERAALISYPRQCSVWIDPPVFAAN